MVRSHLRPKPLLVASALLPAVLVAACTAIWSADFDSATLAAPTPSSANPGATPDAGPDDVPSTFEDAPKSEPDRSIGQPESASHEPDVSTNLSDRGQDDRANVDIEQLPLGKPVCSPNPAKATAYESKDNSFSLELIEIDGKRVAKACRGRTRTSNSFGSSHAQVRLAIT